MAGFGYTILGFGSEENKVDIDYLIVAGGGGLSTGPACGGGGAGGLLTATGNKIAKGTQLTVTVGLSNVQLQTDGTVPLLEEIFPLQQTVVEMVML